MKIFIYSFIAVAVGLMVYNLTFIDFENVLAGDSATALIGVMTSAIAVVLMLILLFSRAIAEKEKE